MILHLSAKRRLTSTDYNHAYRAHAAACLECVEATASRTTVSSKYHHRLQRSVLPGQFTPFICYLLGSLHGRLTVLRIGSMSLHVPGLAAAGHHGNARVSTLDFYGHNFWRGLVCWGLEYCAVRISYVEFCFFRHRELRNQSSTEVW